MALKRKQKKEYGEIPSKTVYSFILHIMRPILVKYFNINFDIDPRIKDIDGPILILGNHPSNIDPFIAACAMYPRRVNFLASSSFFKNPFIRFILRKVGAIPKTQFRADPTSVKSMFKVLQREGILSIFPEGARSIDGTLMPIEDSITKFIKKTSPNLIISKLHGAYLSWPRWSRLNIRRGEIDLSLKLVASGQEVSQMDLESLKKIILASLQFNDYSWQEKKQIKFKGASSTKGLDQILHKCPNCKNNWVLKAIDDKLVCTKCSNAAVMNDYAFFEKESDISVIFSNVHAWNHWQRQSFLKENDDIYISCDAKYFTSYMNEKFKFSGEGKIVLNKNALIFEGINGKTKVEKLLPISGFLGFSAQYGNYLEVFQEKYTYKFVLANGQKVIGFTHAFEAIKKELKITK